ncbi:MAG: hypothetical protein GX601_06745 [Anaerolineales bacterium]|jgi:hypothetical protein|nr:hypothetical protein [Anaerolineales bacterium]
MANPEKLKVTSLLMNDSMAQPTADTIDTNGAVPIAAADLAGRGNDLMIEVVEPDVRATTVTVLAGDNPPAVRRGLGDLTIEIDKGAAVVIGPLETARFIRDDGTLQLAFIGSGGAASAQVRVYLLPKA